MSDIVWSHIDHLLLVVTLSNRKYLSEQMLHCSVLSSNPSKQDFAEIP